MRTCAFGSASEYFLRFSIGTIGSSWLWYKIILSVCLLRFSKLEGRVKSARDSPSLGTNGAATKKTALMLLARLFSAKYFARNIPPREWPMRIMLSFRSGVIFSNQMVHSAYLAFCAQGMRGAITSYSGPSFSCRLDFQSFCLRLSKSNCLFFRSDK